MDRVARHTIQLAESRLNVPQTRPHEMQPFTIVDKEQLPRQAHRKNPL